jgi:hypothetical protein
VCHHKHPRVRGICLCLPHPQASYCEANCLAIDSERKVLHCERMFCEVCMSRHAGHHSHEEHRFELPYDVLVLAVRRPSVRLLVCRFVRRWADRLVRGHAL